MLVYHVRCAFLLLVSVALLSPSGCVKAAAQPKGSVGEKMVGTWESGLVPMPNAVDQAFGVGHTFSMDVLSNYEIRSADKTPKIMAVLTGKLHFSDSVGGKVGRQLTNASPVGALDETEIWTSDYLAIAGNLAQKDGVQLELDPDNPAVLYVSWSPLKPETFGVINRMVFHKKGA